MSGYKLDHKLKIKSEDLIWHMHEYDVDPTSSHIYLMGTETHSTGMGDAIDEPGIEYTIANKLIRNINLCMRNDPDKPILIHMKTCGGYWEEGMAIYDAIKACPVPVTILNYTHARSMSSIIFQAANKRVMMPNSTFMFHDGSLELSGTVKQVKTAVQLTDITDKTMMGIYVEAMKSTPTSKVAKWSRKRLEDWLRTEMDKKEDVFLTAEQAVYYGFADEIFGGRNGYDWGKLIEYTEEQLER